MISVIVPALNEEKTIASVITFCKANKSVSEVLVVDDASEDDTAIIAASHGAKVIHSKLRGKGISMKDGINAVKNEIIVFLDADIDPYPEDALQLLTGPLVNNEADFVKGTFTRNAGRVTELVAKPLLTIFYPGLAGYTQPLSGMIAGRKQLFERLDFFNDYGVDIGILIDMYLMKARIKEVNIGYIENNSKPWEALGKMSREVSRAIIIKAQQQNPGERMEAYIESIEEINREMNIALKENISLHRKMAIFDMDNTLLKGRFIDACAKKFGFTAALEDLREQETDQMILAKRISLLLKGRSIDELLDIVQSIQMAPDIKETITSLKRKGYITGIISNSYTLIANYVAKNLGMDFSFGNQLEIFEGHATGEVNMPSYFFSTPSSFCGHTYCKTNALQYACEKYNVHLHNCIAVGDSQPDRCMVGHSGKGFAYRSKDNILRSIASVDLREESFTALLEHA